MFGMMSMASGCPIDHYCLHRRYFINTERGICSSKLLNDGGENKHEEPDKYKAMLREQPRNPKLILVHLSLLLVSGARLIRRKEVDYFVPA